MNIVLFGSADIQNYTFYHNLIAKDDYVICCDGGLEHAKHLGLTPHIIVGDFDSVSHSSLSYFAAQCRDIHTFPREKDATDLELGLHYAFSYVQNHLENNQTAFKEIIILGGIGSRLDHTLGNVFLLKQCLDYGIPARLIDENHDIFLVRDSISFHADIGSLISLIPYTDMVSGVTSVGLFYPLCDTTLSREHTVGISNVCTDDCVQLQLTSGILIVIKTKE